MRKSQDWQDYRLIDASDGQRLEKWGGITLVRPDPQIIWKNPNPSPLWSKADAVYHRSSSGGGNWEYRKQLPESWNISYKGLTFMVKPTGFKHTGIFPEQAVNWDLCSELIKNAGREINVLNMLRLYRRRNARLCKGRCKVCHLDAVNGY
ncbi:SAM-dependent methyltransferase, partial [human gut metagenome]